MESLVPDRSKRINRKALVACIIASVLFWISIRLSDQYSTVETISLEYELPAGSTFAQDPPRSIEATVTASGWDLLKESMRPDNRVLLVDSIDLRQNPDGILSIRREVAEAFLRENLRVDALTDPRIVVRTEKVATKRVPLRLRSEISYALGYSGATQPKLSVDSVVITGPKTRIKKLEEWFTDTLVLSNLSDSLRASVGIQLDRDGSIQVSPTTTDVLVRVQQFTERSLYVPVRVVGYEGPDSLTVFPQQVLLTCAIGLSDYGKVNEDDFDLVVEYDKSSNSIIRQLPVIVRKQPDYVAAIDIEPRLLEVFVVKAVNK